MGRIVYCERSSGSLYYMKAPMDERVPYDLRVVAKSHPDVTFVILNDNEHYGFSNIVSKKEILKSLKVDEKLKLSCGCGTKMKYNADYCKACKSENELKDMLVNILGEDYTKALVAEEVNRQLDGIIVKKSGFDPHVVKPTPKKDKFAQGFVPAGSQFTNLQ